MTRASAMCGRRSRRGHDGGPGHRGRAPAGGRRPLDSGGQLGGGLGGGGLVGAGAGQIGGPGLEFFGGGRVVGGGAGGWWDCAARLERAPGGGAGSREPTGPTWIMASAGRLGSGERAAAAVERAP